VEWRTQVEVDGKDLMHKAGDLYTVSMACSFCELLFNSKLR